MRYRRAICASEDIQGLSLLGCAADPGSWGYFDGNEVVWETRRFIEAYGAPLLDDMPSVMTQHDEGW